MMRKRSATGGR